MGKRLAIAQRVRALKVGQSFVVSTEKERQQVCRIAKSLRDAGVIEFDVVTKSDNGKFKVAAI
jgi:hypothetical protein